jgi:hypothetical protein
MDASSVYPVDRPDRLFWVKSEQKLFAQGLGQPGGWGQWKVQIIAHGERALQVGVLRRGWHGRDRDDVHD